MKTFILKTIVISLLFLTIAELVSRIIIDPYYYYYLDSYNLRKENPTFFDIYKQGDTEHVDYLFIGTSRVPATINPSVFMKENSSEIAVVSGKGYMTAGIHYQALENRTTKYPDYLKGAKVFIEYPGSGIYTNPFSEDKFRVFEPTFSFDKPMPHMLLPHIDLNGLFSFFKESKNSIKVKINLFLQYVLSSYRTSIFIKEKIGQLSNKYLFIESENRLVEEGGIRNDNMDDARKFAVQDAALQIQRIENSPELSMAYLEKSSFAYLNKIVTENGGTLFLYKVPLISIQEKVHNSSKAALNKAVFEQWVSSKEIEILTIDRFSFDDSDFPDALHLSIDRRDEFSSMLYKEINGGEILNN